MYLFPDTDDLSYMKTPKLLFLLSSPLLWKRKGHSVHLDSFLQNS